MRRFTQSHLVLPRLAYAQGGVTRQSNSVDVRGNLGVAWVVQFGSLVGVDNVTLRLQGSADNSTWANLEGTDVAVSGLDVGSVFVLELTHAPTRYVRLEVAKAGDDSEESAVAILFRHGAEPVPTDDGYKPARFHAPALATA